MRCDSTTWRGSNHVDTGTVLAVIGSVGAVLSAVVAGFWTWLSAKRKTDLDAQASLVTGFIALLAEFKAERELLVKRIVDLEANNHRRDRHVRQLERIMARHGIIVEFVDDNMVETLESKKP